MLDPRAEYTSRWKHRKELARRAALSDRRFGHFRLVLAALGVLTGWLVFAQHMLSVWMLTAPITGFIILVFIHERNRRLLRRARRAADFYAHGLERLDGKWAGRGLAGERYLNETHPYVSDLDIFGRGSLYELMCTARTVWGQRLLARWLLEPAAPDEIRARQEAVEELRNRLDLREETALMGEVVRRGVHAGALPRWGSAAAIPGVAAARLPAAALSAMVLLSAGAATASLVPTGAFLVALVAAGGFGLLYRTRVLHIAAAVEQPAHDLDVLAQLLSRLEREEFTSARLRDLQERLKIKGAPPSRRIARLGRLVELLDSRDHLVMRLVGPPLLWSTQVAFAVEAWRQKTGPCLRDWLTAVGELEALSAVAGYAYEHSGDPFPEFAPECSCFNGRGLGHPLLPEDRCVRNDVLLDPERQVLLVSGSNMSGKSTLLRTVGANAVLAMAGAPVRAESLRLAPLKVGASIRVVDSLQSGTSRFYAEITKIRQIMDMNRDGGTLLFLLDEILHGTNSHDRRIGAEAIVRKLVAVNAIGLVTTHDLAIAHLEGELQPRVRNVHFQDRLEAGKMMFDYKLRAGIVEHSNAIELMRSVGLEV